MLRLGLWGEGAPFENFEAFLQTVYKKGLGWLSQFKYIKHNMYNRTGTCIAGRKVM